MKLALMTRCADIMQAMPVATTKIIMRMFVLQGIERSHFKNPPPVGGVLGLWREYRRPEQAKCQSH